MSWRRMGRIIWSDSVKSEEVLPSAKDDRSIPLTIKGMNTNRYDHMLRRNCRLNSMFEGKKEGICFGRSYDLLARQNPFRITKIPVYWCWTYSICALNHRFFILPFLCHSQIYSRSREIFCIIFLGPLKH
jgi:hypothetical protein